jgi:RNA polymerase sigma factor (sigma-70 family)
MTDPPFPVIGIMDHPTPDHPGGARTGTDPTTDPAPTEGADARGPTPRQRALWAANAPLGELFRAMRSGDEALGQAAWEACYQRCWQLVWTRVFYVMRTISWLGEPREMAADVTSDVFVGLPDAVKHYRDEGKPEQWLKQIAVRTALRRRESLTGRWSGGKSATDEATGEPRAAGRSFVPYDESAEQIVDRLDRVDREELMELERRREALRNSPDETRRRWDQFLQLYIDGYDFREIGERIGITEASARNWLCKIRKHLAEPVPAGDGGG